MAPSPSRKGRRSQQSSHTVRTRLGHLLGVLIAACLAYYRSGLLGSAKVPIAPAEPGIWQGTKDYWVGKLQKWSVDWHLNQTLEETPVPKFVRGVLLSDEEWAALSRHRKLYYYDDSRRSVWLTVLACVPTFLGVLFIFEFLLRGREAGWRRAICVPRLVAIARLSHSAGASLSDLGDWPRPLRSNGSHPNGGSTGHATARRRSYREHGLTWTEWVLARQVRCRIAELARVLFMTDEAKILECAGMDALVILRFCSLCGRFCALSAVWCGCLLPVWWASGTSNANVRDGSMKQYTLLGLWTGSPVLWTVVAAAYLCTLSLCGLLWKEYEKFVELRCVFLGGERPIGKQEISTEDYISTAGLDFPWRRGFTPPVLPKNTDAEMNNLLASPAGQASSSHLPYMQSVVAEQTRRTVMVERIPPEQREPAVLRASFEALLGAGTVHSVAFVPSDSRKLSELLEERRSLVRDQGELGRLFAIDEHLRARREEYCRSSTWSGNTAAPLGGAFTSARPPALAATKGILGSVLPHLEPLDLGPAFDDSMAPHKVELHMAEGVISQERETSPSPTLQPSDPPAHWSVAPPRQHIRSQGSASSRCYQPFSASNLEEVIQGAGGKLPSRATRPSLRVSWPYHTMQELFLAASLGVRTAMGAVGGAISAVSDVASEVAGTSVERVGQLVPASLLGTPVPSGLATPINGRMTPKLHAEKGTSDWNGPNGPAPPSSTTTRSSTAFVTLRTLHAACVARQVVLDEDAVVGSELVAEPAPEPRDIIWHNAAKPKGQVLVRTFFTEMAVWLGLVFWSVPVTLLQAWCSAERLHRRFPWLALPLSRLPAELHYIWSLYLPVLALLLLLGVLPTTLHTISRYYEGMKSKSALQMLTMKRYWRFQLATLGVTTASGSLWSMLSPAVMGDSVPKVATYFLATVLSYGLVVGPVSLLRLPVVAQVGLARVSHSLRRACCLGGDKKFDCVARALRAHPPDLAADLSMLLLVLLVVVTYATIFPLIMLAGLIFFVLRWQVLAVRYLYVLVPRFDSGGAFFYLLWDQALVAMFLGDLVTLAVVGLQRGYAQLPFLLPLPLLPIAFKMRAEFRFAGASHRLSLRVARAVDGKDPSIAERFMVDAYWHPALRCEDLCVGTDRGRSHLDAVDEQIPADF